MLVTHWHNSSEGPFYRDLNVPDMENDLPGMIDATMSQLSKDVNAPTDYHLTPIDLSLFPSF